MDAAWCGVEWGGAFSTCTPVTALATRDRVRRPESERRAGLRPWRGSIRYPHLRRRAFFRWLVRENALLANPAADLVMPRPDKRLPRAVLSPVEADTVMNQPNVRDAIGLPDRAMLETLYSTGMRRSELLALKVDNVDAERGTVTIRLGKGRKDRLIPIGERVVAWVDKYLREVRPGLALGRDEGVLFLTELGESLVPEYVTHRLRKYVEAADVGQKGACHIFRHYAEPRIMRSWSKIADDLPGDLGRKRLFHSA